MSKILIAIALLFTFTTSLDAAVYKGQKTYKKKCKVCHGGGQKMAVKFTQSQWGKQFRKKGKRIASLHINSQRVADQLEGFHKKGRAKKWNVKKVNAYFKSKTKKKYRFKKMRRHLLDFFQEYAKDTDAVPACN